MSRCAMTRLRGGMLLEVVVALAVFVSVGLSVSVAMRTGLGTAIDLRNQAIATDIARSAIAQVRAGISDPDSLDGAVPLDEHFDAEEFRDSPEDSLWTREIGVERSGFTGLSLVTVTVRLEGEPQIQVVQQALVPDDVDDGLTVSRTVGGAD